jgi:hypothetical protein
MAHERTPWADLLFPSVYPALRTGIIKSWKQRSSSLADSCDPEEAMKIFLGVLAVLVVAASLIADYKWRQWMAARRRDRP